MATKMVMVNSLPVAKRWLQQMKDTYHKSHHKKLGIWEKERQTINKKSYGYSDSTLYVVGHSKCIEVKVNHLGKRIDNEL